MPKIAKDHIGYFQNITTTLLRGSGIHSEHIRIPCSRRSSTALVYPAIIQYQT